MRMGSLHGGLFGSSPSIYVVSRGMKAALVTGAPGFIGRALCARLQERGVGVRALARRETAGPWDEFVVTDLDAAVLDGIDTVFHLAGKAHL